ncbi:hypothetical protein QYF36_027130 [Acer negundo]|nr:hypothetical protein QYF36_027130 [Acer negundo]
MAFLSVKSRQLPAVSFGSPTFLSLLPAKPPQQLSFPAAMLPSSAATYKLVAVPSKPYWSSVCLMCRSKGDEEVDKNDMESPFIVILCLMAIALIIGVLHSNGETGGGDESSGPRQAEKQNDPDTTIEFLKDILHSVELTIKENKFEEVERVADYILNLIIGRYDEETGRRKGSRDGAEAGRRDTGGGLVDLKAVGRGELRNRKKMI